MTNSIHQSLSLTLIFLLFSLSSAHTPPVPCPPDANNHVETHPVPSPHDASHTKTTPVPSSHDASHTENNPVPSPHKASHTKTTPVPSTHNASHTENNPVPSPHKASHTKTTPIPSTHNASHTEKNPVPSPHKASHTKTTPVPSSHNDSHIETTPNTQVDFKGCFSKVYAFGDSYTDTGNAHFLGGLNVPFSNNAKSPPKDSSTTNYTNRLCNGRLVVDFLSEALYLPPLPPYKEPSANFSCGVNFAIAGSTVFSSDHFSGKNVSNLMWNGIPMNVQTQMDWFNKYMTEVGCKGGGGGSCKDVMENALFWLGEMGVVDYGRAQGSQASLQWLREVSVRNVGILLKMLLEHGAKYIVVQGLPPVGCLPLDISTCPLTGLDRLGCAVIANKAIMIHNQILKKTLLTIQKLHPDCSIVYADYWSAYLELLSNPKKYNLDEPFKACCGSGGGKFNFDKNSMCGSHGASICKDPSKYMSWDGIHLTEATYKHLSDLFLNKGYCKPSFSEMIKRKQSM